MLSSEHLYLVDCNNLCNNIKKQQQKKTNTVGMSDSLLFPQYFFLNNYYRKNAGLESDFRILL